MSGTQRLPGGERRKASQRHSRPAEPLQPLISRLWHPGDRVRWRDRIGVFRRDVGDSEHAEIVIADRTYRVRVADLCLRAWSEGSRKLALGLRQGPEVE